MIISYNNFKLKKKKVISYIILYIYLYYLFALATHIIQMHFILLFGFYLGISH